MDMERNHFFRRLKNLTILNTRRNDFKNVDLYKVLLREEALTAGYEKIRNNSGATTPASDGQSLPGFGLQRLLKLQDALRDESWQPRPARRKWIPKPGKTTLRPLGIQGPEEKIVQAVVALILEAIYEPRFFDSSYGFRRGRGPHDALDKIDQTYDGMIYAIEGDIKSMFDSVNHHTLINLLEQRICDPRFIRLIWKLLRGGYLDAPELPLVKPVSGTPQGSIVSPVLANVLMHEFDASLETFGQSFNSKTPRLETTVYKERVGRTKARIQHRLKQIGGTQEERQTLLKEFKYVHKLGLKLKKYRPNQTRLVYVRYAHDFIIGLACKRCEADLVLDHVRQSLKRLDLILNETKTKRTPLRTREAYFLGYRIGINTRVKYAYVKPKNKTRHLKRTTGHFVSLQAPMDQIIKRLSLNGFCSVKGWPVHKKRWTSQDDDEIVRLFNLRLNGLLTYYDGSHQRRRLGRIWYILRFSCAKTLAAKHRKSLHKIFAKHGPHCNVVFGQNGQRQIALEKPDLKEKKRVWHLGKKLADPYAVEYRSVPLG